MAFKINHLHLKTPDPRKTVDWYVKYVGAKIVSERKTPNGRTTFRLNLHGVELNVTEFLEEQKLGSSTVSNMSPSIPTTSPVRWRRSRRTALKYSKNGCCRTGEKCVSSRGLKVCGWNFSKCVRGR